MSRKEAWEKVAEAVGRGDPEDTLNAIADWLDVDRNAESHPLVRSCLESAAEHCRHAAMDYYVSTK